MSADSYMSSSSSTSSASEEESILPCQPGSGRSVFLERWLREQARFHSCDEVDFIPLEESRHGGHSAPRGISPLESMGAIPGRQKSEGAVERARGDERDLFATYHSSSDQC